MDNEIIRTFTPEQHLDTMNYNRQEIYNWFDTNYIESKEECKELLIQHEIDTPNTIEKIFEACVEIKRADHVINRSLKVYLKFISDLSFVGISGDIAGKKIKEILLGFK